MLSLVSYIITFASITLLFPSFFFISCNAPHSNPFDPNNDDKSLANITGTIKTVKIPSTPISEVTIYWPNDEKITSTDSDGNFIFEDIPKENGYLYFEKNGYSPDSVKIDWDENSNIEIEGFLNSNPKLIDLKLYSIVLNDYITQKFSIEVIAEISDEENDIDSVFVIAYSGGGPSAIHFALCHPSKCSRLVLI